MESFFAIPLQRMHLSPNFCLAHSLSVCLFLTSHILHTSLIVGVNMFALLVGSCQLVWSAKETERSFSCWDYGTSLGLS